MRTRSAQLTVTLVCIVFGALLMIQLRTQGKIAKAQLTESSADQAAIISSLYDANVDLRREVGKLAVQQQEYQRSLESSGLDDMVADVTRLRVFTGLSEVSGPGVELRVAADIRPEYVQDLINELRNAGAEALALNGLRIVASSSVRAYQGKVVVDGTLVDRPFVFEAVGQPDTLDRALARKGGMVSYLKNTYPDADITLSKRPMLALPIYTGDVKLQYAQPAR